MASAKGEYDFSIFLRNFVAHPSLAKEGCFFNRGGAGRILIDNIDRFILDAPVSLKIKLLGSMFPEKIEFDGKKYRTQNYNKVLDFIYQQTNELRCGKKENGESFSTFSVFFFQNFATRWNGST